MLTRKAQKKKEQLAGILLQAERPMQQEPLLPGPGFVPAGLSPRDTNTISKESIIS